MAFEPNHETVTVSGSVTDWLKGLAGTGQIPTKLAFRHPAMGPVTLLLAASVTTDRPIEVLCNAGGIGIPVNLRTSDDQHDAQQRSTWTEHLAREALALVHGDYAAIGEDADLPTPSEFASLRNDEFLPYAWLIPPSDWPGSSAWDGELISLRDPVTGASTPNHFRQVRHALAHLGANRTTHVDPQTPRRVRGTVTRHEPYGFHLDFGEDREGVVVLTMIAQDPSESNPPFPPVGAVIEAVLLGYTGIGREPRLSVRPQDFEGVG
jgi:hypothetical protein